MINNVIHCESLVISFFPSQPHNDVGVVQDCKEKKRKNEPITIKIQLAKSTGRPIWFILKALTVDASKEKLILTLHGSHALYN
jgi:hypothetical protein